jgi:acyl-CoA hydrolase
MHSIVYLEKEIFMQEIQNYSDYGIETEHLVMSRDLNIAGTLFGGSMMAWIDESAAMFAMKIMKTKMIVTHLISELEFDKPVKLGDFLAFGCKTLKEGRTSLAVSVVVFKYDFCEKGNKKILIEKTPVVTAKLIFVAVDEQGNKREWPKD